MYVIYVSLNIVPNKTIERLISMGKYEKKKKPTERPTITCSWGENSEGLVACNFQCKDIIELNSHIESHIEIFKEQNRENGKARFSCTWSFCNFSTNCFQEIERHLYYHGYYTGLLAQGKYECNNTANIPSCNITMKEGSYPFPKLTNDFRCEWGDCERKFASVVEFQAHVIKHIDFEYEMQRCPENERPKKVLCNWGYCKKYLENKYRLVEHVRTHINKKELACSQCGELFRTKTTLFDHLRRQPENNTNCYQCAQCFKFFATQKLLRAHVVKHVNCHKCSLCDMTCSTLATLATHVRYRHLKDKPFKCRECDLRWVRENDLVKHIQFVHTKEDHRCDVAGCYYSVRSYNLLRRHFLEVHGNSPFIYVCHCCDKPFKTGKTLSSHLVKKHDFQLPSGHTRFTYRVDENGFYRLETMRIESLEVTQQLNLTPSSVEATEVTQDNSCYEIVSLTNKNERVIVSNDSVEAHLVGEVVISLPVSP